MIEHTEYSGKILSRIVMLLAAILALVVINGCASGNYATFDRDRDLDNKFLNYEVLPDHNYYTTGSYSGPAAILALKNDYELENTRNLWVYRPNVNSGQVRVWITTIDPQTNYRRSSAYFAAYILDPAGNNIGAWYAVEPTTTVKFLGDNKVQVYPPFQDLNIDLPRGIHKGGFF